MTGGEAIERDGATDTNEPAELAHVVFRVGWTHPEGMTIPRGTHVLVRQPAAQALFDAGLIDVVDWSWHATSAAARALSAVWSLYEMRLAAADLAPDRDLRERIHRLRRAQEARGVGADDLVDAMVRAAPRSPARDRDNLVGLTREIAKDLDLADVRDQLHELVKRADVVTGKPGPDEDDREPRRARIEAEWAGIRGPRTRAAHAKKLGIHPRTLARRNSEYGLRFAYEIIRRKRREK